MRSLLRKCVVAAVLMSVVLMLTACISSDEAKALASDFALCISEGRYDDASALMHPDAESSSERIIWFINDCKAKMGIDFSEGFEITEYTGFSNSFYDSSIGGSFHELEMKATVGETEVYYLIQVIDNKAGYGIYHIEIGWL